MVSISDAVCSRPNAPSRSLPMPTCRGVAGNLADVVNVVDQSIECDARAFRSAPPPLPARHDHPRVERRADHGAPLHQGADLIVGELPVVRHERTAIGVARPHRSAECGERLPEARVAEMRCVEDHTEPLHLPQQLPPADADSAISVRAVCVRSRTVVCRSDCTETGIHRLFEVPHRHDGVGALEAQDVADRNRLAGVARTSAGGADRDRRRPAPAPARHARSISRYHASCPCVIAHACSGECQPGSGLSRWTWRAICVATHRPHARAASRQRRPSRVPGPAGRSCRAPGRGSPG